MNDTEENYIQEDSQPFIYVLNVLLYTAVFLVGLVGNILVIYAVLYFPKMRTVTNIYIINLAVADMCFLLGIPVIIVTMIRNHWIFGPVVCKMHMTSTSINQFTTALFMLVISIDRYIAVCHPNCNSKLRTLRISRIVSLITWIVSILLIVPIFQYTTEVVNPNGKKSCVINWWSNLDLANITFVSNRSETGEIADVNSTDVSNVINNHTLENPYNKRIEYWIKSGENLEFAFITYTFVLSFALPLSLIAIFYGLIVRKLVAFTSQDKTANLKSSRRKVTKMVLIVIAVYVICWLPHWIMQWLIVTRQIVVSKVFIICYMFISWLSYSNSAINPILYGFLSKNFRKGFLRLYMKAGHPLLHKHKANDHDSVIDKFEIHSAAANKTEHLASLMTTRTIDTSFSDSRDSVKCEKSSKPDRNTSMETTSL